MNQKYQILNKGDDDDGSHCDPLSSTGGCELFTKKHDEESGTSAEEQEVFESDEKEHSESDAAETDQLECKQKYHHRNRVDKPSVAAEEQAPPRVTLKIRIPSSQRKRCERDSTESDDDEDSHCMKKKRSEHVEEALVKTKAELALKPLVRTLLKVPNDIKRKCGRPRKDPKEKTESRGVPTERTGHKFSVSVVVEVQREVVFVKGKTKRGDKYETPKPIVMGPSQLTHKAASWGNFLEFVAQIAKTVPKYLITHSMTWRWVNGKTSALPLNDQDGLTTMVNEIRARKNATGGIIAIGMSIPLSPKAAPEVVSLLFDQLNQY